MALRTIQETAQRLRRSKRGVYDLLESGALQALKLGGRTVIQDDELDRFEQSLPVAVFKTKPRPAVTPATDAAGLVEHRVSTITRPDGGELLIEQVLVTPNGLAKLAEILPPAASKSR